MSEYYFAVLGQYQTLEGGEVAAKRRDEIAKIIEPRAGYIYYYDDAEKRWRGWGYCPNLGAPFDQKCANEIQKEWAFAGI